MRKTRLLLSPKRISRSSGRFRCRPRLFTVPFSVNSPVAADGGTSTRSPATIRLELPVPAAASFSRRCWKSARSAGCEAICWGVAQPFKPAVAAHTSQSGKMRMRTSLRSAPHTRTSLTSGRRASKASRRSFPALTFVPEVSLKSSLIRPSKRSPALGCAGSMKLKRSPD